MSQTVTRLKELLFDHEARALVGLEQRLDALTSLNAIERDKLVVRIDRVSRTIDNDNELAERIAIILSESLRRAEIADHKALSANLAPLVVRTIKAELLNSRDEMVEALYPITGELVKAYVASAIRDLNDQMNKRLEQNAFLLRVQSLLTGRSTAELALAGSQDWQLEDLYLVRRKTGALLARWPQDKPEERDHAMSGILAAINEFASEVLGPGTSGLKQIELGENRIYVRASPMHILAARVSGTPPMEIQSTIDEAFIRIIDALSHGGGAGTDAETAVQDALDTAGSDLESVVDLARERARSGPSPLATLAAFILMPVVLLLAYLGWEQWTLNRSTAATREIVASVSALRGYPVHIESAAFGKKVTLTGLVPDDLAHQQTLATVRRALPATVVVDKLSVVRQAPPEIKNYAPDIAALRNNVQSVDRALQEMNYEQIGVRSIQSLLFAANDLDRAAQTADDTGIRTIAGATAKALRTMTERLQKHFSNATNQERPPHDATTDAAAEDAARALTVQSTLIDLQEAVLGLERFMNPEARAGTASPARALIANGTSFPATLDRLGAHAQRAETLAAALALSTKITRGFVRETPPTPREALIAAITNTAIFFSERNTYRDSAAATRTINAVADALKKTDSHLRIIGYTDDTGTTQINQTTSLDRAEFVRQAFIARGVPASRLSSVGRSVGKPLGMVNNASLRDRRVEFELAFPGEPTQ